MKSIQTLTLFFLTLFGTIAMHGMHRRKTGTPSDSSTSLTSAPAISSSPYAHMSLDELKNRKSTLYTEIHENKKKWREENCYCCLKEPEYQHCALFPGMLAGGNLCLAGLSQKLEKFNTTAHAFGCEPTTFAISSAMLTATTLGCVIYATCQEEHAAAAETKELKCVQKHILEKEAPAAWKKFKQQKAHELSSYSGGGD